MEPTPPKTRKPRKHVARPFYETSKKTSAEIVNEARSTVRTLDTKRPATPLDKKRTLFDPHSGNREGRPSSAISIGPGSYYESRPPTGKLTPLEQVPDSEELQNRLTQLQARPPSSPSRRHPSSSNHSSSENVEINNNNNSGGRHTGRAPGPLMKESVIPTHSSEPKFSHSRKSKRIENEQDSSRRVHSGPKERTHPQEGDHLRRSNSSGDITPRYDTVSRNNPASRNDPGSQNDSVSPTYRSPSKRDITSPSKQDIASPFKVDIKSPNKIDSKSRSNSRGSSSSHSSRSSSAGRDKDSIYFEDNIQPLLKQIELNFLHEDMEALIVNLDMLWRYLENGKMFGKQTGSLAIRRRSLIMNSLYKLTSADNSLVLMKMSRLAIAMEASGKNLVSVCKILFKVSKDSNDDDLFSAEDLIEPILQLASKCDFSVPVIEGSVYLVGCLRFLSTNQKLLNEMIRLDCLKYISNLLTEVQKKLEETQSQGVQLSHTLVQIASCLANLADVPALHKKFLEHDVLQKLFEITGSNVCSKDSEYMMNFSRILSKLTLHNDVNKNINHDDKNYDVIINSLKTHYKKQEIAVRLSYAIGNMASRLGSCRHAIAFDCNGIDVLLNIGIHYWKICTSQSSSENNSSSLSSAEDVTIKVIRAIANLGIDEKVGVSLSDNKQCISLLMNILEPKRSSLLSEELCINVMTTANNLSFFAGPESLMCKAEMQFSEALVGVLLHGNMECILEAMRSLGNFTKSRAIRRMLIKRQAMEVVVALLDSSDPEMVFCVCGVLINMMNELNARDILRTECGIQRLVDALSDLAYTDWVFASMACQLLLNLSDNITTSAACFGEQETDDLIQILKVLLDKESVLDYSGHNDVDKETKELLIDSWHQSFQPIATTLLTRIVEHHTYLEPLIEQPG